jgi:hypothetical protein
MELVAPKCEHCGAPERGLCGYCQACAVKLSTIPLAYLEATIVAALNRLESVHDDLLESGDYESATRLKLPLRSARLVVAHTMAERRSR